METLILRLIADGAVVLVFLLAVIGFAFFIPRKQWGYWSWRIVGAGLTAYAAAKLAGWLYQPELLRPFEKLGVEPGAAFLPNPGFPSDHALFAMFLTLAVWYSTRNKWLAGTMFGLTVIMSIGRVLALVHTPLDVIGGMLIATVSIVWYRRTHKNVVQ